MAKDDDLELADEKKGGGGIKKILIVVVASLLVVGLSVGVTLYFTGAFDGEKETAESDAKDKEKVKKKAEKQEKKPPIYLALTPEFIVNFEDQSQASFLQIEIQIMGRDSKEIKSVEEHMPVVRNNILLLLGNQKYEEVRTREGKNKLRADILSSIRQVLKKETGKPGIEAVYFTSFLMQ